MNNKDLPAFTLQKPRILLVEDEATLREHLAEALSDEYVVDTAGGVARKHHRRVLCPGS